VYQLSLDVLEQQPPGENHNVQQQWRPCSNIVEAVRRLRGLS